MSNKEQKTIVEKPNNVGLIYLRALRKVQCFDHLSSFHKKVIFNINYYPRDFFELALKRLYYRIIEAYKKKFGSTNCAMRSVNVC